MCHCSRRSIVQEPKANIVQQPLPLPQEGREEWNMEYAFNIPTFVGLLNGLVSVYSDLGTDGTQNTLDD